MTRVHESESGFQGWLIGLAGAFGWLAAHFRPAMTKSGRWVTAVAADGKGFPDLVLVRERVVFAELKSDSGRTSPEQRAWIAALEAAGQEVYVWRPRDRADIEAILRERRPDRCTDLAHRLFAERVHDLEMENLRLRRLVDGHAGVE